MNFTHRLRYFYIFYSKDYPIFHVAYALRP